MLRHRERRALPVAREAGVGYARVLRHSVADAAFDEPAAQHAQADALDVYPVVELEQIVVLYRGDEGLVEGVVDAVDIVAAAAALVGVERLGEARDCRQIKLVVVRGQRVGLDERADLEYLMYVADGDGKVYVGLNEKLETTGTGTITGEVGCKTVYAVAGATISDETIGVDTDAEKVHTAYYVEDTLWITVYNSGTAIGINDVNKEAVPVENAYFDGTWLEEDGTEIGASGENNSNVGQVDAVYADIEYDIYVINLRADQNAISSISIDGNLMQFGMIAADSNTPGVTGTDYYYGYTITVAAGNHTVSYTLANGYSGEGVLTVNGEQQSGLTFTTEGEPTTGSTVTYNLQLTGFEKSGYVPDSPDTGSDGDSGMTITDYLLIVLVVLIIVMAIIVAMRLMRS